MARNDNTVNTDALAATIRELEESNASLAQRVGELETEIAQRDETIARQLSAAEQRERDIGNAHNQVRELGALRDEFERQRDVLQGQRDEHARECIRLAAKVERLDARRGSGAPLALDITALLELHRIVGSDSDRYLATARRLGDALVAQLDASDPG